MNHCIIQAIVSVAYNYFIPLLFSAGKIDIFERITIIKSVFSDACHTAAYSGSFEITTTEKRLFFDTGYTVGDCYTCQTVTTIESIRADFFNSVWNCISVVLLPFRIQDKRRFLLVEQHVILA